MTPDDTLDGPRAELVVDLAAVRHNVVRLRSVAGEALLMAVVKADAYGHGMVQVARAARAAGAGWLGVATLDEALALRRAGDRGRMLTWLGVPGERYDAAVAADVDLTVSARWQLADVVAAVRRTRQPARVQLKVDTGLSRNGAGDREWPRLLAAAVRAQAQGQVIVTGVWSHLACADEPAHPSVQAQQDAFEAALDAVAGSGLEPEVRHLANSAAMLTRPSSRFDLVRCGLAVYGLSPIPLLASAAELGLRPAMSVRARLASVKPVPAGRGVSYGHTYVTPGPKSLGLVPLGYAEGIPVATSNAASVSVGAARCRIVGRVCMDQFVVDLGDSGARVGDQVVVFGPGDGGEPTAQDWAEAAGTIVYEIVTRMGGRAVRRFVEEEP